MGNVHTLARRAAQTVLGLTVLALAVSTRAYADPPRVVATTPWTAAFAYAAGVEELSVLASYEMRHPPEYELRATDIVRVQQADFVIFAGYEAMIGRLRDAIGGPKPALVQIATDHRLSTIEASVMKIAEAAGSVEVARRSIAEIREFVAEWREEVAGSRIGSVRVIAHVHQKPILDELGIETAGVFGPGPLSARQIADLTESGATLVVDVWHNESAAPLRETMPNAVFVSLINFPGRDGTRTLLDVLKHTRSALAEALARLP